MKLRSEASHWAALEETGILWGMQLLLLVYRAFGRLVFRVLLHPVVGYYFLASSSARSASRKYLQRVGQCYPELGIRGSLWDSYRHFLAFGGNLLEKIIVWLQRLDPSLVEFHNRQMMVDLLNRGQGAILLSGHIGNPEICRALADLRGHIRLNILIHTKHAERFNRLLRSVDAGGRIELIQVTDLNPAMAIRLQQRIQQGEFLVMVGDRIPVSSQGRTVRVSFLGEEADFPQGPYLLASLLQCPVYTVFSYLWEGHYHIYLDRFAEHIAIPRREPDRSRELALWAGRFAGCMETHCHRVPLQWFNFYSFWGIPLGSQECQEAHTVRVAVDPRPEPTPRQPPSAS